VGEDSTGHPSTRRVSVQEAAEYLGTTVDAIRKRVQRDTIAHEKDADGRVWVHLDASMTRQDTDQDTTGQAARDELVEELRDQVRFLREELARKDAILLRMAESIPQLEAPSDERGRRETATEPVSRETPFTDEERPQETAQPRSRVPWWQFWR
jgi:hypothetical protein